MGSVGCLHALLCPVALFCTYCRNVCCCPEVLFVPLLYRRELRDQLETSMVEVKYADERMAALWENCRAAKVGL